MLESSTVWTVPFDFKPLCGVILAKLNANTVAIHGPKGWDIMTLDRWTVQFLTPFPLMCPWSKDSAGWCIIDLVEPANGQEICRMLDAESLTVALEDDIGDLKLAGFKPEVPAGHTERAERFVREFARPLPTVPVISKPGINAGLRPTLAVQQPMAAPRRLSYRLANR